LRGCKPLAYSPTFRELPTGVKQVGSSGVGGSKKFGAHEETRGRFERPRSLIAGPFGYYACSWPACIICSTALSPSSDVMAGATVMWKWSSQSATSAMMGSTLSAS